MVFRYTEAELGQLIDKKSPETDVNDRLESILSTLVHFLSLAKVESSVFSGGEQEIVKMVCSFFDKKLCYLLCSVY